MWEFIDQYFIRPVYTGEGYNIFNTLIYAACFIAGLYLTKWLLEKWKIKIGKQLFYTFLPYFVLGGLVRALQDFVVWKHWLLITPGIYLLMIALTGAILIGTKKNLDKTKTIGWLLAATAAGMVFAAAFAGAYHLNWLIAIVGSAVTITALMWKVFPKILSTRENRIVALAQVLDGCASAIPIAFLGYSEQHVLSTWVMGDNPFVFLGVKIILVIAALHVIDRDKSDWNWLLKLAIVLLGLAPGIRDLARVFMGV